MDNTDTSNSSHAIHPRRDWMAVLARTPSAVLEPLVDRYRADLDYSTPRPAEIGLCQVRGRMGGEGKRFNLGEMTVTRCERLTGL